MIKTSKISFPVQGMTCASCVARVEKAVAKAEGVRNVSVNLATEKVLIEYESDKFNPVEIEKLVDDSGYKIDLTELKNHDNYADSDDISYKSSYEEGTKNDFIIALIFTIPVAILNMGMMWDGFTNLIPLSIDQLNKILLLLTTPILFIPGKRFFSSFWKNTLQFTADMNSLVAIGTGAAYTFSLLVTLFPELISAHHQDNHVYFDTTAVIITLILMGKWLEARAKSKTGNAVKSLLELRPANALVLIEGKEIIKSIADLKKDDIVVVKPGERIPADGKILKGFSAIDESMISGESVPVEKSIGSEVIGGTINKSGSFEFQVSKTGDQSLLGQIIKLVEDAQGSKAPIQQLADKVAAVFVPAILVIALITFLSWMVFAEENSINSALINFIAVLIIACPCALGLATPTALIVGMGKGARNGVLFKDGQSLESFHKIKTLIFDKTGTITIGKPSVNKLLAIEMTEEELLSYIIPAERRSEHPLAKAIIRFASGKEFTDRDLQTFENLAGFGIKATVDGNNIIIGNKKLMIENSIQLDKFSEKYHELSEKALSVVWIAIQNNVRGIITIEDPVKENAKEVIKKIAGMGVEVVLLTGDNIRSARSIAEKAGISNFKAEVLPADKASAVAEYRSQNNLVAMVGDGINDAPALAQADVGVAIGTGTDIAIETADIVLMSGNLSGIPDALKLSRDVIRTIKQNLFWAFLYNSIGIPLAALGMLSPVFAALAMSLSSVSVVSNSLRLKAKTFKTG